MKICIDNTFYKISDDIEGDNNSKKTYLTILQKCNTIGIKIPRFCYHESLSIAGNCRMCLIEKEKVSKPIAACAINITENLKIFTKSFFVKKIRENVLEFLLINHPLDCPICDQGGECDLQDQSILYGNDRSRFNEPKRAVIDKECGTFIKTIMTRCIHCTRCVRFLNEISGFSFFGVLGRGLKMEISTYILNNIKYFNEFSGNIIDICPVGALTSKPYSFNSRPWELFKFAAINVIDPLASYFSLNYKNNKIYRVLPYRENVFLVTEWITDTIRFFYDGINIQRIKKPYYIFKNVSYFISLKKIIQIYKCFLSLNKKNKFDIFYNFVLDNTIDFSFLKKLKQILQKLPLYHLNLNTRLLNKNFNYNINRMQFLIFDLKNLLENSKKNFCLILIGLNPRIEFYHLYLYLRKKFLKNNIINFEIISLNSNIVLNFEFKTITNNIKNLYNFLNLKKKFSLNLKNYKDFCNFFFFYNQSIIFKNIKILNLISNIQIKNNNNINNKENFFRNFFIFNNVIYYSFFELGVFEKYNIILFRKKVKTNLNFYINTILTTKNKMPQSKKNLNLFFSPIGSDIINNTFLNIILPTKLYLEKSMSILNLYGSFKKMKSELNYYNILSIKNLLIYFTFFLKAKLKKNITILKFINLKNLYISSKLIIELIIYNIINFLFFTILFFKKSLDTTKWFFGKTIVEKNSINLLKHKNLFDIYLRKNFNLNIKTYY